MTVLLSIKIGVFIVTKALMRKTDIVSKNNLPLVIWYGVQKMACTIPVYFVEKNIIGTIQKIVMTVEPGSNPLSNVKVAETVKIP